MNLDASRGRPSIPQQRQTPLGVGLRGSNVQNAQPKFTPLRGQAVSPDLDMTWPQQQQLNQQQRGKGDGRVSIYARDSSERPVSQLPSNRGTPIGADRLRAMSPPLAEVATSQGQRLPARSPVPPQQMRRPNIPQTLEKQAAQVNTNDTNTLEKLLSGVEDMRATMQRDMSDRNATGESITKNAVTALLESLRGDTTECSDRLSASVTGSELGSAFGTSVPVDLKTESHIVLSELASIISDEKRLHEASLPAACEVLRTEAEKVLREIETLGSLVHKRFQEETVPAACDVLKCEVQRAVNELKNIVQSCGSGNVAMRAETDNGVALLREAVGNEMRTLAQDGEQMKAEAKKAISDMIDQEHRLQKDMIRSELSKATAQLKEVVASSARSLAEAVPREREILRSESEKAAMELRNFVDYEKRLRQEVLLKEVAQQAESEARLEQHWSNLIKEEVAHHITHSLANFEGRLATVESSAISVAPTQNLDSTTTLSEGDFSRLSALEAQVQSALAFGAKSGSLEARIASLEQLVQASTARVAPVEARVSSLEQQVQAAVASAARAAPQEDVRELRTDLSKMRGLTEDVSLLVSDMAKLRPLIQEVGNIQIEVTKLQDISALDMISDVASQVTKLQDLHLPDQILEIRGLVHTERQERSLARRDESTRVNEIREKLQHVLDGVDSSQNKFETSIVKLHGEMASVRASIEELRSETNVQKPLRELRSEQQEQKTRMVTVAQTLATIEDKFAKDMNQTRAGLALVEDNVKQVSGSLKEETASRLSTVARIETSIDDVSKESNRIRRRMESLHQLIMHGNKSLSADRSDDTTGTV